MQSPSPGLMTLTSDDGAPLAPLRVLGVAGRGGRATVYQVLQADGAMLALKHLHPALRNDPAARTELRREAQLLSRLGGPAVVRLSPALVERVGPDWLALEWLAGGSWLAAVEAAGLGLAERLTGLSQIADALAALAQIGYAHGDLRSRNVCSRGPAQPVLIDFGQAQAIDEVNHQHQARAFARLVWQVLSGREVRPMFAHGSWPPVSVVRARLDGAIAARSLRGRIDELLANALEARCCPDPPALVAALAQR